MGPIKASSSHNSSSNSSSIIMVVDLRDPHLQEDVPTLIAVQVCAGLFNRDERIAGAAYTLWAGKGEQIQRDDVWARELLDKETATRIPLSVPDFISKCLSTVAKGRYIHYHYHKQRLVVPNLLTLAAVLHAVPLVAGLQTTYIQFPQQLARAQQKRRHKKKHKKKLPTMESGKESKRQRDQKEKHISFERVFDAEIWKGYTAYDATKYMFHHHVHQTTTLSLMNPGYQFDANEFENDDNYTRPEPVDPHNPMVQPPAILWADYVVKEKLFNFYLPKGCIPGSMEHALLEQLSDPKNTPWPQPLSVYGYNDVKTGPCYLFEADTLCVHKGNMGHVATQCNNLAFWSRRPPITEPLRQPYPAAGTYDSSQTYLGLVIGDGDNVAFVKNRNSLWMKQRQQYCANQTLPPNIRCFPISWSISPHLLHLAPDLLRWFYQQAQTTGQDFFLLPPSGYTYSYPSLMEAHFQDVFVHKTEEVARLLNTTGSVDWEWALTWRRAIRKFFPRYAGSNSTHRIRGLFPVNVPYNLPVFAFGKHEYYKLIHHSGSNNPPVVLFKPQEWRGTSGKSVRVPLSKHENLTPQQMAKEINGYPKGSVAYLYLTSDDHCDLDSLYELVQLLDPHVQVVNHEVLIDMALQRG